MINAICCPLQFPGKNYYYPDQMSGVYIPAKPLHNCNIIYFHYILVMFFLHGDLPAVWGGSLKVWSFLYLFGQL